LAGWCDRLVDLNAPSNYSCDHGDYCSDCRSVMKYCCSANKEYFLVEIAAKSIGIAPRQKQLLSSQVQYQAAANYRLRKFPRVEITHITTSSQTTQNMECLDYEWT
jgi:hypothetical protein